MGFTHYFTERQLYHRLLMDMKGIRNDYLDFQVFGTSESKGYDYRNTGPEKPTFVKKTPELDSTPKLIAEFGGLGIFEFVATYYSQRVTDDPLLDLVYGGLSQEQRFVLHVGLLLFCLNDEFKGGDRYRQEMIERARENPTLMEHCRLGLMKNPSYFNHLFHHLMESVSVCRCRKSFLRLVSRFAMLRLILQGLDTNSLSTIREHKEEFVPEEETSESDSDDSSLSFCQGSATNE